MSQDKTFQVPSLRAVDAAPITVQRDGGAVVYEPIRALRNADEVRTCLKLGSMGSDAVWTAVLSVAFQPETLSVLLPLAMQSDKRKAASKVSGALKRAVLAVAADSPVNADTVGQYASTVAQHFAQDKANALIACYTGEGENTRISAFVPRAALLKSAAKPKETAAECLARLCKAYAIHAGSGIPVGTVSADDAAPMLHAIAQSVGGFSAIRAVLESAESRFATESSPNIGADTAAAERVKAELLRGKAIADAVS